MIKRGIFPTEQMINCFSKFYQNRFIDNVAMKTFALLSSKKGH